MFMKMFRRILYKPNKRIAQRKLLNRLTPLGLAIWYMDDGGLSQKKRNGVIYANELMLNTWLQKTTTKLLLIILRKYEILNLINIKIKVFID